MALDDIWVVLYEKRLFLHSSLQGDEGNVIFWYVAAARELPESFVARSSLSSMQGGSLACCSWYYSIVPFSSGAWNWCRRSLSSLQCKFKDHWSRHLQLPVVALWWFAFPGSLRVQNDSSITSMLQRFWALDDPAMDGACFTLLVCDFGK